MINYTLLADHNSKRIRFGSSDTDPISIIVGAASESWPAGCYIEVLNVFTNSTATINGAPGVTINYFNGTELPVGAYARVSQVEPGEWDCHIYFPGTGAAPSGLQIIDADGNEVVATATIAKIHHGLRAANTGATTVSISNNHVTEEIAFGVVSG